MHALLRGFAGFVQADAKRVYDLLYREPTKGDPVETTGRPASRSAAGRTRAATFYEAAITKSEAAREALYASTGFFENEERWAKESPSRRRELRQLHSAPHVRAFFAWAELEYAKVSRAEPRERGSCTAYASSGAPSSRAPERAA